MAETYTVRLTIPPTGRIGHDIGVHGGMRDEAALFFAWYNFCRSDQISGVLVAAAGKPVKAPKMLLKAQG